MKVTIYHNPRCSKSRETLALIRGKGIEPEIVEYLSDTPNASALKEIVALLGMRPADIIRRKEAREAGIDPDRLDEKALIAAMVRHPSTIERPIVVAGRRARLGRPPERVLEIL